jgi:hypothetical protein
LDSVVFKPAISTIILNGIGIVSLDFNVQHIIAFGTKLHFSIRIEMGVGIVYIEIGFFYICMRMYVIVYSILPKQVQFSAFVRTP